MSEPAAKTVQEVKAAGAAYLQRKGVPEATLNFEWLLSRALGCRRLELAARHAEVVPESCLVTLREWTARAAAGEPVQYILGDTEFMGHVFKTDARALIPRPETELLVEAALADGGIWEGAEGLPPLVADVGTGTGCIAISLALARPEGRFLALDASEEALCLARENAATHGVTERIGLARGDLSDVAEAGMLSAVVANLPYIRTADWEQLPRHIRDYEPRLALDGGAKGLDVIEVVVEESTMALRPGGRLLLEIGCEQGRAVQALLSTMGFEGVEVRRDLAGLDRIVTGVLGY